MRSFKYLVLAFVLLLPFSQGSFGVMAHADSQLYPYEGKTMTQLLPAETPLGMVLPHTIRRHLNGTFSNLDIRDNAGNEVDFGLYRPDFTRLKGIEYLEGTEFIAGAGQGLVDDSHRMGAIFPKNKTRVTMLFDLGRPVELAKLRLDQNSNSSVSHVQISGTQQQGGRMQPFLKKKSYSYDMDINSPIVRYIEVELWGKNISLQEMSFYQAPGVVLIWDGEPGKTYDILYGGVDTRKKYEKIRDPEDVFISGRVFIQLREEIRNESYNYDDGDTIDFWDDNCGFEKNSSQQDSDRDKVGDACDNAPEVQNRLQQDTDYDGIGDLVDNCRYTKNEDQKDKDGDEIGNACDTLPGVKNNAELSDEPISPLVWLALVAVLITAGVFGADYYFHSNKEEVDTKKVSKKK